MIMFNNSYLSVFCVQFPTKHVLCVTPNVQFLTSGTIEQLKHIDMVSQYTTDQQLPALCQKDHAINSREEETKLMNWNDFISFTNHCSLAQIKSSFALFSILFSWRWWSNFFSFTEFDETVRSLTSPVLMSKCPETRGWASLWPSCCGFVTEKGTQWVWMGECGLFNMLLWVVNKTRKVLHKFSPSTFTATFYVNELFKQLNVLFFVFHQVY